ncbi:putative reverse transcriptase domain-containing protein [Tanacetum coccineum]
MRVEMGSFDVILHGLLSNTVPLLTKEIETSRKEADFEVVSIVQTFRNWDLIDIGAFRNEICAPILALLKEAKICIAYAMLRRKGLGAVLMQSGKCVCSQDLENYLYGTKCTVFTDHKSLQHILDQKELNMRQRRLVRVAK